ncbi:MAG: DNA-3-methyladenine glycosylase [Actinomycetota bacterium]|nr:DNA-3-methyladenine glycosylase [Actinomycetota bacterium]
MIEVSSGVWMCAPAPRKLLRRDSDQVAPMLLGMLMVNGDTGVVVTEVEAYGGPDDQASHAYGGISRRNRSMFDDGGTLYVYLSYGIHRCINVVTGSAGDGQAVLIRSGIVISKSNYMADAGFIRGELVTGPGRLGKAIDAQLGDDGVDLFNSSSWKLLDSRRLMQVENGSVERSVRVGISRSREFEWRFQMIIGANLRKAGPKIVRDTFSMGQRSPKDSSSTITDCCSSLGQ